MGWLAPGLAPLRGVAFCSSARMRLSSAWSMPTPNRRALAPVTDSGAPSYSQAGTYIVRARETAAAARYERGAATESEIVGRCAARW